MALPAVSIDLYLPALPALARDLDAGASAVQLTLTGLLVGLGCGQVVIGPLSDIYGRRRPLLVGIATFVVASLLCAAATTALVLDLLRFVQGVAAAAGSMSAVAIVRDRYTGRDSASMLSKLTMVMALAPVLAPTVGASIVSLGGTWRTLFLVLALYGVLLGVVVTIGLRETHPVRARASPGLARSLRAYRDLLRDRSVTRLMVVCGLVSASVFTYVSHFSFVLQDGFGLDDSTFAVLFGVGAVSIMAGARCNVTLLARWGSVVIVRRALGLAALAAAVLVVNAATGLAGVVGVLVPIWVILAMVAMTNPNVLALALAGHRDRIGAVAALVGLSHFVGAGLVPPLVRFGPASSPLPMAVVMAAVLALAAAFARLTVREAPVHEPAVR
jgi:DHA1 family bicyclomycin/chloramphenicol resistance-like MFS transporter